MVKRLSLVVFLAIFSLWVSSVSANLTQLELTPTSLTCNATGTIYYSSATNQLMLCTSGTGSSPIVTGASNVWTLSGSNLYPNNTSYNVGIGTTGPASTLDVRGHGIFQGSLIVNNAAVTGTSWNDARAAVLIGANDSSQSWFLGQVSNVASSTNNIGLYNWKLNNWVQQWDVNGNIDAMNNRVVNIGAPINANDAATKSYVDSSVTGGGASGNLSTLTVSGTTTLATASGNVGIGNTAPNYKLDVSGVIGVGGGNNTNYFTNSGSTICLESAGACTAGAGTPQIAETWGLNLIGNGGNRPVRVVNAALLVGYINTGTSYPSGNLLVSGNVGIGTASPNAMLSLGTSVQDNKLYLFDGSNDKYGFGIRSSQFMIYSGAGGASTGGITFGKYDGTTFTESMRITNAGNVGIGTTLPATKLQVVGNVDPSGLGHVGFDIKDSLGDYPAMVFEGTSGIHGALRIENGNGFTFYAVNNGTWAGPNSWTNVLRIQENGYVGIGGITPGTNLDVAGNAQASIFYDRDNTSYYLDPAANTMPYAASLNGGINMNGSVNVNYNTITSIGRKPKVVLVGYNSSSHPTYDWLVNNGYIVGTIDTSTPVDTLATQDYDIYMVDGSAWADDSFNTTLYTLWKKYGKNIIDTGNDTCTGLYPVASCTGQSGYSGAPGSYYHIITRAYQSVTDIGANGDGGNVITAIRPPFQVIYTQNGNTSLIEGVIGESEKGGIWFHDQTGFMTNTVDGQGVLLNVIRYMTGADSQMVSWRIANAGYRNIFSPEVDNGSLTGTTTIDWSQSNTQTIVLGNSIALAFTNGQPGGHYTLALKQDATGSRTITSWGSNVRWSSGVAPTLTTTANKTDYIEFVYDGLSSTFDGVGFNANF
ncbi:hypothetical protein M1506_00050 [Patescibacteria group bacterium]|nr:hypothetical protein [Patescibacteria group bacterium]